MAVVDRLNNFCHPVSNFWVSYILWGAGWGCILFGLFSCTIYFPCARLQWEDATSACSFYRTKSSEATVPIGANTSCHDEVDFSLCFEDTAILYGICTVFWVLAGFSFFRGNPGLNPPVNFRPLYASKLVCPLSSIVPARPLSTSPSSDEYTLSIILK